MGTNDLANGVPPHRLAKALVYEAQRILKDVQRVIICVPLPRAPRGKHGRGEEFTQLVNELHAHLFNILKHSQPDDARRVYLWFHKKFRDNVDDSISQDGVHIDEQWLPNYVESLKSAIYKFSKGL
jgi:hypothetical protein